MERKFLSRIYILLGEMKGNKESNVEGLFCLGGAPFMAPVCD